MYLGIWYIGPHNLIAKKNNSNFESKTKVLCHLIILHDNAFIAHEKLKIDFNLIITNCLYGIATIAKIDMVRWSRAITTLFHDLCK